MNTNFFRGRLLPLLLVLVIFLVWKLRQDHQKGKWISLVGETMGTTYNIKYNHDKGSNYQVSIDSLLKVFNQSLSTYIPDSEISQFNRDSIFYFESPFFPKVLQRARQIHQQTQGTFNPAVMPLVNAWGFGPQQNPLPDSTEVDSILQLTDFRSIVFDDTKVTKLNHNSQLDFSAIAKGYGVDIVADFLRNRGITHLFVEIGGEVVAQGKNDQQQIWTVGINAPHPSSDLESIQVVIRLDDRALATSGNYRNFYIKDGKKYVHTINPETGYPIEQSLLSASVFADDCITADAIATAFMVMCLDRAKKFLEDNPRLEAYLIYSQGNGKLLTFFTEGMKEYIVQ
ncbi:MAG: FAD:protein FMN transferase [Bacteroidetes bacterium]|nr:FAD:protein FMN transferase [Bacteroidota bacterium]